MPDKLYLLKNSAYKFEQIYGGCTQAVLAAFKERYEFIPDELFRAGTGLAGGVGLMGDTCGALLGGALVIGAVHGRPFDDLEDEGRIRYETLEMVKELYESFEKEYKSIRCYDIQTKIMGKSFNLWDEVEKGEFLKAGGHNEKCPSVCKNAVIWVYRILVGRGLIE